MAEAESSLTSMLSRFGVDYQNAPKPTPALLAFMRGMGMSLDTAEDASRQSALRMKERATQGREEISRQNDRSLQRMAGDLASRGVLSSGETNTKVARQAEDVAKQTGDIEQGLAEGLERNDFALNTTRDQFRQAALERTLGVETDNATREAATKAQEDSWAKQTEANDLSYKRQKEAQDAAYAAQESLYKKYSGLA